MKEKERRSINRIKGGVFSNIGDIFTNILKDIELNGSDYNVRN